MINRRNIFLSGLVGLVGAMVVTGICVVLIINDTVPIFITNRFFIILLAAFFGILSVAEIPLMVYAMYQMQHSVNPKAGYALLLTNTAYTFFGGFYACCLMLLTGQIWLSLGLATLSFLRFISAIGFLGKPQPEKNAFSNKG